MPRSPAGCRTRPPAASPRVSSSPPRGRRSPSRSWVRFIIKRTLERISLRPAVRDGMTILILTMLFYYCHLPENEHRHIFCLIPLLNLLHFVWVRFSVAVYKRFRIRHLSQWKFLKTGRVTVYAVKSRGREGNLSPRGKNKNKNKFFSLSINGEYRVSRSFYK